MKTRHLIRFLREVVHSEHSGIPDEVLAKALGVSEKEAKDVRSGASPIPTAVLTPGATEFTHALQTLSAFRDAELINTAGGPKLIRLSGAPSQEGGKKWAYRNRFYDAIPLETALSRARGRRARQAAVLRRAESQLRDILTPSPPTDAASDLSLLALFEYYRQDGVFDLGTGETAVFDRAPGVSLSSLRGEFQRLSTVDPGLSPDVARRLMCVEFQFVLPWELLDRLERLASDSSRMNALRRSCEGRFRPTSSVLNAVMNHSRTFYDCWNGGPLDRRLLSSLFPPAYWHPTAAEEEGASQTNSVGGTETARSTTDHRTVVEGSF